MNHKIIERPDGIVVALDGEVDLETSPAARRVLLDVVDRGRAVFVDLSAVSYIDSSGIASLVEALQKARTRRLDFALVAVSDAALRVLQLARLDKVFSIYPSVEEA